MDPETLEPKDLIPRIARYSNLRAAERAITPTVRSRTQLPSYALGRDLLETIQDLKKAVARGEVAVRGRSVIDVADEIDAVLDEFSRELRRVIRSTSMVQFRATLPGTTEQAPEEVQALLDFCLTWDEDESRAHALIDYGVTLLATRSTEAGRKQVLQDPCRVSPGIAIQVAQLADLDDRETLPACNAFRDAAIELLAVDDIEPIIREMRSLKRDLAGRMFQGEILRTIVAYNVAAANRLAALLQSARTFDEAADQALRSLRALDLPTP